MPNPILIGSAAGAEPIGIELEAATALMASKARPKSRRVRRNSLPRPLDGRSGNATRLSQIRLKLYMVIWRSSAPIVESMIPCVIRQLVEFAVARELIALLPPNDRRRFCAFCLIMCLDLNQSCCRAGRPGCVVNIVSIHGLVGAPAQSTYGISKAAIIHMTKMLAIAWGQHRIRINAIAPGRLDTSSPARALRTKDQAYMQAMLQRIPLHRIAAVEEVAAAVACLASARAASITGRTLVLDGALTVA